MITVASHPADLSSWNPDADPLYLEVLGENRPILDMTHAEIIPPGGAAAQTAQVTPVYEYWWTLGHGGHEPERRDRVEGRDDAGPWGRLRDIAAHVSLYFPISGGWRIQELAASVKYLAPVRNQTDWSERAAAEWQRLQPVVAGAGQAAAVLGAVPGVGMLAAGVAPVLSAASKLQLSSVPQAVKGFEWYVRKVTFGAAADHGVMQGIVWAIPQAMFHDLGGRLTGSLAVSFLPTAAQGAPNAPDAAAWTPQPLPVLARAVVHGTEKDHWVPARDGFIALTLAPQSPAASGA